MGDISELYEYDLSDEDIQLLFRRGGHARQVFTCRHCGVKGLRWKNFFGQWFPCETGGKKHVCHTPSPKDAFTVIS